MTLLLGKNSKIRFQVVDGDRAFSDRWTAFRKGSDIYLTSSSMGSVSKISLHASGICRWAINENLHSHDPPLPSDDRAFLKWRRSKDLSEILHSQCLSICFVPFIRGLAAGHETSAKSAKLPYPPINGLTEVCVFFSESNPLNWNSNVWLTRNILGVWEIEPDCFCTFRWRLAQLEAKEWEEVVGQHSEVEFQMHVGGNSPWILEPDVQDCLLGKSKKSHARFYCLMGVPRKTIGERAMWATTTGHLKRPT